MADTRVLSVRFTSEEYELLQSMSLVTGNAINAIIRGAVIEKASQSINDSAFLQQAEETKRRIDKANASLREKVAAVAAGSV